MVRSLLGYEETFSFSPASLAVMLGANRINAQVAVAVLGAGPLIAVVPHDQGATVSSLTTTRFAAAESAA